MVRPLFDTNILIDYLGGIPLARDELARYQEPAISIVSWMEVLIGAEPEVEPATRRFLSRFTILEIDRAVAERAGHRPQELPDPTAGCHHPGLCRGPLHAARHAQHA